MGKKNKNKNKNKKNHNTPIAPLNISKTSIKPVNSITSSIRQEEVFLTSFDENEDTDPGLDAVESPLDTKPIIPIIVNSAPKKDTHPCDNPIFCRLANDFVLKFESMTRAYLAWKHKDFDIHLLGLRTDLINKLYSLQWIAKEMRDLLPRELQKSSNGTIELVPSPCYEHLYQQLMPCDNKGVLSQNPDERDEALFRLEQERDSLRNLISGLGK